MGLWDYIKDAATLGPARRAIGHASRGNWKAAAQQTVSHGSPYAAHVMGNPEGQPLGPSSGAFAPRKDNPFEQGWGNGLATLGMGALKGYTGAAAIEGGANLAAGGDPGGGGGYAGDIAGAAERLRQVGRDSADRYNQARDQTLGYLAPAQAAYDELYGSGSMRQAAPVPTAQRPPAPRANPGTLRGGAMRGGSPDLSYLDQVLGRRGR